MTTLEIYNSRQKYKFHVRTANYNDKLALEQTFYKVEVLTDSYR